MGILLVYDVSDEESFTNVRNWMRQIDQNAAENVNRILIGNKSDVDPSERVRFTPFHSSFILSLIHISLTHSQKVSTERGKALANEYGIKFFETSAKLNTNVDESFMSIAKDIVDRLKENPEHYGTSGGQAIFQNEPVKKKESSTCC